MPTGRRLFTQLASGFAFDALRYNSSLMNAVLIHNPTAGPREVEPELDLVVEYLSESGWRLRKCVTDHAGQATRLARQAAQEGVDVVLVSGGDGTVCEAVNGWWAPVRRSACCRPEPAMSGPRSWALPVFTLTTPNRLLVAAHLLREATTRTIDVGRANDRYFLLFAGLGLDATVARDMEPRERVTKQLGLLPYLVAGVAVAVEFYGVRTVVVVDNKKVIRGRSLFILISNAQLYGGVLRIAPEARLDDGLLDVVIFNGVGPSTRCVTCSAFWADGICRPVGQVSARAASDGGLRQAVAGPDRWRSHRRDADDVPGRPTRLAGADSANRAVLAVRLSQDEPFFFDVNRFSVDTHAQWC